MSGAPLKKLKRRRGTRPGEYTWRRKLFPPCRRRPRSRGRGQVNVSVRYKRQRFTAFVDFGGGGDEVSAPTTDGNLQYRTAVVVSVHSAIYRRSVSGAFRTIFGKRSANVYGPRKALRRYTRDVLN